jgi:hypothetical protein
MDLRATPDLIHLSDAAPGRGSVRLEPARGYRVVAISGEVWITQAGRIEDYVLRAGEALTLDSPGAAIISSFGLADIEVIAPPAPSVPGRSPMITAETMERAQREARRLHAQAVHEIFAAATAWVWTQARRVGSLAAGSSAAPGAAPRRC